ARYYEPATSRWISPDPAGFELINPMEPDGEGGWKAKQSYSIIEAVNWYAYVSNNPLRYIDPTGLESADAAYSWLQAFEDAPKFQEPGEDLRVTSNAGWRILKGSPDLHKGKDFGPTVSGDTKQKFQAAAEGEVARTGYEKGKAGNYTVLKHENDYESKYFHAAEKSELESGTPISAGQEIGTIGSTGKSDAPHLHLEIHKDGVALDPDIFLNRSRVMYGEKGK
ncbi:hypothetical protein S1OALGB6SA_1990, partial [Olavius algarvensis spirochete endosymbiont]|uniref:peptidoglycan DD-metalloendopeptidase family protein n=1 Tax=Olavius algarvensis spirochete endosymbiont TaxID=260710 RepID=UPI000F26BB29